MTIHVDIILQDNSNSGKSEPDVIHRCILHDDDDLIESLDMLSDVVGSVVNSEFVVRGGNGQPVARVYHPDVPEEAEYQADLASTGETAIIKETTEFGDAAELMERMVRMCFRHVADDHDLRPTVDGNIKAMAIIFEHLPKESMGTEVSEFFSMALYNLYEMTRA